MFDFGNNLRELASQVQELQAQFGEVQAKLYFMEFLLLFISVAGVAIFLWRRLRYLQALKGTSYKRARGLRT
jgi:hypothetical protein